MPLQLPNQHTHTITMDTDSNNGAAQGPVDTDAHVSEGMGATGTPDESSGDFLNLIQKSRKNILDNSHDTKKQDAEGLSTSTTTANSSVTSSSQKSEQINNVGRKKDDFVPRGGSPGLANNHKGTFAPRALSDAEATELRKLLKTKLKISPNNDENNHEQDEEDADVLLDYAMQMIQDGENVGHMSDEVSERYIYTDCSFAALYLM